MPINKQDATRALELLEQYQTQLNAAEDAKLRAAIERVIRIFKSKLFNALVEIQEFYEVTLLDENKSLEQKALETQRVADRWADAPPSSNGPPKQQKASTPSRTRTEEAAALPEPSSHGGAFEVVLHRSAGQGFGFSIAGGVDEPHLPGDSRLFVTKVVPGGVANADGQMSVGDVILAVNGVDVTAVSHEAAVSALKMSGAQLSLLMLRPPQPPPPPLQPAAAAPEVVDAPAVAESTTLDGVGGGGYGGPVEVTLAKTSRGLGFSIAGGADNQHLPGDDAIFVTKVIEGGAAQRDGRIEFADRLLAVDGRPLTGCTHQEAVAALKATGDRVHLTVVKATPDEIALLIELDEAARAEEEAARAAAAAVPAQQNNGDRRRPSGPEAASQHRHSGLQGQSAGDDKAGKKSKGLGGLFGAGKKK